MHYFIETFKYIAQSNTINFIIMVGILWYIVKRFDLMSGVENAVKNVALNLKKSDEEVDKSRQALKLAEDEIKKLPDEIKRITDETDAKAEDLKKQIESSTLKTIENINANIPKILRIEEKKISNQIVDETVRNAIASAESNIVKILDANPELHIKFIEDSLADFDKVKL